MLCGHVHGEGRRSDEFQGRTVYTILQDYQDAPNGGNGFLRTLTFSPANNQITVDSWSPTLNRPATKADVPTALGKFTVPYNMQNTVSDWISLGSVNVQTKNSNATHEWSGLEPGKNYEWHATTNDGNHTKSSEIRRFSTATP